MTMLSRVTQLFSPRQEPLPAGPPEGPVVTVEPPPGAGLPPTALSHIDLLTQGELRRRVDAAIDQAVAARDTAFISPLATFMQLNRTATARHVKLVFADPQQAQQVLDWLRCHYGDLLGKVVLQLHFSAAETPQAAGVLTRKYSQAASVPVSDMPAPRYFAATFAARAPYAEVTLTGAPIAAVVTAVAEHVRALAQDFGRARDELAGAPQKRVLAAYLATLLSSCPADGVDETARTGEGSHAPDATLQLMMGWARDPAHDLPGESSACGDATDDGAAQDLLDLFTLRALREQMHKIYSAPAFRGHPPGMRALEGLLRRATSNRDTLAIAAAALMLRQQYAALAAGISVTSVPATRPAQAAPIAAPIRSDAASSSRSTAAYPTLVSTEELATIIPYTTRTIRESLCGTVFLQGTHFYVRPGGRKMQFDVAKCLAAITGGMSQELAA